MTIDPDGSRSRTGGVTLAGNSGEPARFAGLGSFNRQVNISLGSNMIWITGPGTRMRVRDFEIGSTPTAILSTSPRQDPFKSKSPMRRPDCGRLRRLLWARSMTQPAPETIRTPKTRIACDGTGDGLADAALGHPRVWLEIDTDEGFADCGYCDRRFILIGGIADKS